MGERKESKGKTECDKSNWTCFAEHWVESRTGGGEQFLHLASDLGKSKLGR